MAKARIGHFAEAQILEALGVDMVDESEGNSKQDVMWSTLPCISTSTQCFVAHMA